MKTKVKKLSDTRIELTVTLDAQDLKPVKKAALEKLAQEVRVSGFRKGKVPINVAQKFIPENDLNAEIVDRAVRSTVISAFTEAEKSPLVLPHVDVTKYIPGQLVEYKAVADIVPEVKVGDFKKLGVKKPEAKVAQKDIDATLDRIATSLAERKVVKRAAAKGDEVIIDFVGRKDGKKFEGGFAKDYRLLLGSGTFIPGFEEGIVGHASGDKFNIDVTFPKDYGVADLAGAPVVFEILVKQVNEITKPKCDDALAQKCGPFKTLAELKEDIKQNLLAQEEHRLNEQYKDQLVTALLKKSKVPAPDILIEDQLKVMKEDLTRNAASRGMTFERLLEASKLTEEEWRQQAQKTAKTRVQASLLLQTLAIEQKITVSDEEVAAKIAELREVYKKSSEALKNLKNPNVKMEIKNRLTIEKTLDFLVAANKSNK